ncbi:guanylate kinase [Friedmanniella endophytica]|uniref:Guanylate kinase n=1 Tax=Microlunatus kandeliicorticis TaxID=1759536 RepID=A0A7W3P6L7_9ACTN|nr:guanylate kinase [Microlunatus kandeliicorticis]MBA8795087.1 guanylate kinase [Microlunatus kandeliicorticis]
MPDADRLSAAEGRDRRLTVVSGPAGVGKGTVVARLAARRPEVWVSVSATTRPPRPGEVDGVHYLFVSDAEFDAMAANGELLEWAVVHGAAKYGTPREPVLRALAAGRRAVLEIETQGARQVRSSWPEAFFVFLVPPSWDELVRRLAGRGTETDAQQQRRLQTAREELAQVDDFDATVVNDDVDSAVARLVSLMGLTPDEGAGLTEDPIPDVRPAPGEPLREGNL